MSTSIESLIEEKTKVSLDVETISEMALYLIHNTIVTKEGELSEQNRKQLETAQQLLHEDLLNKDGVKNRAFLSLGKAWYQAKEYAHAENAFNEINLKLSRRDHEQILIQLEGLARLCFLYSKQHKHHLCLTCGNQAMALYRSLPISCYSGEIVSLTKQVIRTMAELSLEQGVGKSASISSAF